MACLRRLLATWPAARGELRDLLWRLDDSQAVDISGLRDAELKGTMVALFGHLGLKKSGQVRRCLPAPCTAACPALNRPRLNRTSILCRNAEKDTSAGAVHWLRSKWNWQDQYHRQRAQSPH